jgi:hypothetical protein
MGAAFNNQLLKYGKDRKPTYRRHKWPCSTDPDATEMHAGANIIRERKQVNCTFSK